MELVALISHVSDGSVAARRDRRQVGIDILFPEPKLSKDVRWHVQSVRRPRSNLRIATSGGQPQLSQVRFVIGMDQVMSYPGMIWLNGEQRL